MKIDAPTTYVKTSEEMETLDFGIDESSMGIIFEILQKSMYSDPKGAIVREIISNSRDAHREVGSNRSIEVEISNGYLIQGDTCLIFRDFGPGISKDRMRMFFSKYGASTKRDSNKQTGGFGLGSKTPFSYVDAWNLRTICDGVKTLYQVAIDETRKGKLITIHEEYTDEPNGTEIIVPMREEDRYDFERKVHYYTQTWKRKPRLIGIESTMPEEQETVIDENHYLIVKNNDRHASQVMLSVDGIPYPVDFATVGIRGIIRGHTVFLKFKTGELSLSANRERLFYNDKTIKKIKDRFESFKMDLSVYVKDQIAKIQTYREAMKFYNDKSTSLKAMSNFLGEDAKNTISFEFWRGRSLHKMGDIAEGDVAYLPFTFHVFGTFGNEKNHEIKPSLKQRGSKRRNSYFPPNGMLLNLPIYYLPAGKKNDIKRISQLLEKHNNIILLKMKSDKDGFRGSRKINHYTRRMDQVWMKRMHHLYGEIPNLLDVELIGQRRNAAKRTQVKKGLYNELYHKRKKAYKKTTYSDFAFRAYEPSPDQKVVMFFTEKKPRVADVNAKAILAGVVAKQLGYKLLASKEADREKIDIEYITVDELFNMFSVQKIFKARLRGGTNVPYIEKNSFLANGDELGIDPSLTHKYRRLQKLDEAYYNSMSNALSYDYQHLYGLRMIEELCKIKPKQLKLRYTVDTLEKELYNTYPMLKLVGWNRTASDISIVKEYIENINGAS